MGYISQTYFCSCESYKVKHPYNSDLFMKSTHKRHSRAHLWGWGMECLLWVHFKFSGFHQNPTLFLCHIICNICDDRLCYKDIGLQLTLQFYTFTIGTSPLPNTMLTSLKLIILPIMLTFMLQLLNKLYFFRRFQEVCNPILSLSSAGSSSQYNITIVFLAAH